MPYRHAHWYVLALLPLIGIAFFPTYWSVLPAAPWEFHVHGATAFAWLLLVGLQSWTIHHGQRLPHRAFGRSSLLLFPLFLAGGVGVLFGMSRQMVAGSEFHTLYAARLVWLDAASVLMMAWFFHEALRHRRTVRLHSAYMLATVIALLPPILGRLTAIPLGVTGPGTFDRLYPGFIAGQLLAAGIAFLIARGRGAEGRPWRIAGWLSIAGGVAFATVGGMSWWRDLYAGAATLPSAPFMLTTLVAAGAVSWSGWQSGKRPQLGSAIAA